MSVRMLLAGALAALAGCNEGGSTPLDPCAISTPGAAWIAFTSNQGGDKNLWLVRADGTCRTQVTTDAAEDSAAAWVGPNALGFFSQRGTGSGIYQHAFPSGAEARIPIAVATAVTSPAWSGDLAWLAVEGRRSGIPHSEIFLGPGGGGPVNSVTTHADGSNDAAPVWSPDGSHVYFVSNRGGVTQVYVMAADGTGQTAITSETRSVLGRPAISPDGKKLAFSRSDGTRPVIWIQDLEQPTSSSNPIAISGAENTDSDPAFDATGTRLAVSRVHGTGAPAIWIVDAADGGTAVQVTTPPAGVSDGQPAFRPE